MKKNKPKLLRVIHPNSKKLGRKTKNSKEIGNHTKFSKDNMRKKVKNFFLKKNIQFLNEVINFFIKEEDKKELFPDEIKIINKKKVSKQLLKHLNYYKMIYKKYRIKDYLDLLKKPLGEIASNEINKKSKNYKESWNKEIIEKIKELGNKKLNNFFEKMTFSDFIDVFLGKKNLESYNELDVNISIPFKKIEENEIFKELDKSDKKYCELLKKYINEFKNDLENKRQKVEAKEDSGDNMIKSFMDNQPQIK